MEQSSCSGYKTKNVRWEMVDILGRKKRVQTNSKNGNITGLYRGINEFKTDYQPVTNSVKDEKGEQLAESHSVLNRWRDQLSVSECVGGQ